MRNYGKAHQLQVEIQTLINREKKDLTNLGLTDEEITKLCDQFYQEAIQQPYMTNSSYVLNELRKHKNHLGNKLQQTIIKNNTI